MVLRWLRPPLLAVVLQRFEETQTLWRLLHVMAEKAGLPVVVVMVYMHILEAYEDGAEIDCVMQCPLYL